MKDKTGKTIKENKDNKTTMSKKKTKVKKHRHKKGN